MADEFVTRADFEREERSRADPCFKGHRYVEFYRSACSPVKEFGKTSYHWNGGSTTPIFDVVYESVRYNCSICNSEIEKKEEISRKFDRDEEVDDGRDHDIDWFK